MVIVINDDVLCNILNQLYTRAPSTFTEVLSHFLHLSQNFKFEFLKEYCTK